MHIYVNISIYTYAYIYDILTCMLCGSASLVRTDCNSIYMYIFIYKYVYIYMCK